MGRSVKGFKTIAIFRSTFSISVLLSTLIFAQAACATVATTTTAGGRPHATGGGHAQTFIQDGFYINSAQPMIVPVIQSARRTLDIEIYQFTDPTVFAAIRDRLHNGVRVRIVKEPAPVGDKCLLFAAPAANEDAVCAEQRKLKQEILAAGGTYVPFNKSLCGTTPAPTQPGQTTTSPVVCFEHGKMIIADRARVLISTGNFNSTSLCNLANNPTKCNRDFAVVSTKSSVVRALSQVFDSDVRQNPYDLQAIIQNVPEITVSPDSFAPMVAFIQSAKKSIRITNQYLKFAPLNDALIAAASRGVKVQVMVASLCAFGRPAAADIARATRIFSAFDSAGVETRMFTSSIKINGKNGYLHAKAMVVDDDRAWVGSVNGSNSALNVNREFGMFLTDTASVKMLRQSFDSDFNHAGAETWMESTVCAKDFVTTPDDQG